MSLQCESVDVIIDVFLAGRSQLGPSSAGDWPDWYSEVTGAVEVVELSCLLAARLDTRPAL